NIRGGRVLDIGCGTGKTLIYLEKRGFDCTGIDVSPAALKEARRLAAGAEAEITWIEGTFPGDFKKTGYDLVIERGFIQHLSNRELRQVIDSVDRLLRPEGYFFTVTASRNRGGGRSGGPPRWSGGDLVQALERRLEVVLLEETVFTPGESGSIPAWRCAAVKRQGPAY
ncbi:MAG: class I SAM-dependent methyltransferase, partial [Spirochaetia bacterium]